jgi:hypothetical protein
MNAERLHAIAVALKSELTETHAAELLQQLSTAMRQVVSEPSQPASADGQHRSAAARRRAGGRPEQ